MLKIGYKIPNYVSGFEQQPILIKSAFSFRRWSLFFVLAF